MTNYLALYQRKFEADRKEAKQRAHECYQRLVTLFGEAAARDIWDNVPKRKGGRPKGAAAPYRDDDLLEIYDEWVRRHPNDRSGAATAVAKLVMQYPPLASNRDEKSIARRIRTLVKERERQKRERPAPQIVSALAEHARTGQLPAFDFDQRFGPIVIADSDDPDHGVPPA